MKKFISIILTLSILFTGIFVSSCVQNNLTVEAIESQTVEQPFLATQWLKKINYKWASNFADNLEKSKPFFNNPFYFFEKVSNRSLLLSLLSVGFVCFNAFTSRAQGFMYAIYLWEHFREKFRDGFSWFHRTKSVSVKETISRLNKGLLDVKGQENAKKEIRKIVYGIAHNKNQAIFNKENYSHGDIIYILGPSGVGKTFVSLRIAKALSNHEPFIISASDVDL